MSPEKTGTEDPIIDWKISDSMSLYPTQQPTPVAVAVPSPPPSAGPIPSVENTNTQYGVVYPISNKGMYDQNL